MNKNLKNSLIIILFLFVIIGLTTGANAIVKPIIANNEMKEKIKEYSTLLDGIDSIEDFKETNDDLAIIDRQVALNNNKEVIGYLYKATGVNSFGAITLVVAIDDAGVILGIDGQIVQTLYQTETKAKIKGLKGTTVIVGSKFDGHTGATVSADLVSDLMNSVASAHSVVVVADPYLEYFGEDYVLSDDATFTPTTISSKRQVAKKDDVILGYIYTSKDTGVYNGTSEKSIEMEFILNEDNVLIGYLELEYLHTVSYKAKALNYLKDLIEDKIKISELVVYEFESIDGSTYVTVGEGSKHYGAANSVKLLNTMLLDIKEVITK